MTVHIDLSKSKATLADVVELARQGETIVIDREGKRLGELTFEPSTQISETQESSTDHEFQELIARVRAKHPFFGALAHLGPLTEEEATLFLEPDPEMERLARSEDEDEFYL